MVRVFNILLFLLFKAAQIGLAYYLITDFKMRYDMLILLLYGFLSFFQLLFFILEDFSKTKKSLFGAWLFRYTPFLIYSMELIIIGVVGYFLWKDGNSLSNLLLILNCLMGVNLIFCAVFTSLYKRLIVKTNIIIKKTGFMTTAATAVLSFGLPIAYMGLKIFVFKQEAERLDIYMLTGTLAVNAIFWTTQIFGRILSARKVVADLYRVTPDLEQNYVHITDVNEQGQIMTETKIMVDRIVENKKNISLFNSYISRDIRSQITMYSMELGGELKNATVSTLLYSIDEADLAPERYITIANNIVSIIGNYADEYDAYPLFHPNEAILVFGAPFYYDHHKYHGLESMVKIMTDIIELAEMEDIKISVHTGIASGKIICGAVNSRGKHLKEYTVIGPTMDNSQKIAAVSKKLNYKLLCTDATVEHLKTKFYVEKIYKIKLNEQETLSVSQVKV